MGLTAARELAVLGLLREHPLHGYALAEVLDGTIGPAIGLTNATTYAILKRFTERGWVRGTRSASSSAPDRVVFEVTDAGLQAWTGLLSAAARPGEPAAALVALVAHLDGVDGSRREEILRPLVEDRRRTLEALEQVLDHGGSFGAGLRLRHRLVTAELEALTEALAEA